MNAIVLAAGFATRLYPLTRDHAKPLLDVGGRPVLDRLLDRVIAVPGLRGIVIVTNRRFHAQFEAWLETRAGEAPLRLLCDGALDDESKLGGIADMALAMRSLPDDQDTLVVAGDNLLRFDLAPYAARFRALHAPCVLARHFPGGVPPGRYGEIETDRDGRILRFREKPPDPRSNLAAACLYFFPPEVPSRVAEYLAGGGHHDAPGHFIAWLAARVAVHALPFPASDFFDIGNRETLEQARRAFAAH